MHENCKIFPPQISSLKLLKFVCVLLGFLILVYETIMIIHTALLQNYDICSYVCISYTPVQVGYLSYIVITQVQGETEDKD